MSRVDTTDSRRTLVLGPLCAPTQFNWNHYDNILSSPARRQANHFARPGRPHHSLLSAGSRRRAADYRFNARGAWPYLPFLGNRTRAAARSDTERCRDRAAESERWPGLPNPRRAGINGSSIGAEE